MLVILASCGNPDHFQDPDRPLFTCEDNSISFVSSFEEASQKCVDFIKRNDLGGGNWKGGQIIEGRHCVARVSYNGKVLFPSDKYY